MARHPVSLDDIGRAANALKPIVYRTPVLENADVNAMLGGRLLLKAENFQRTGAFKIRGAYHRLVNLSSDERARGAVTYSSGNHGLGLARAAQILDSALHKGLGKLGPETLLPSLEHQPHPALDQSEIILAETRAMH